ncbi:hypothetical protein TrVGV298_009641 [Trichoderma virens]|nr:hypothetical protein TrVGV298_009641 [Trichoderma virens]
MSDKEATEECLLIWEYAVVTVFCCFSPSALTLPGVSSLVLSVMGESSSCPNLGKSWRMQRGVQFCLQLLSC